MAVQPKGSGEAVISIGTSIDGCISGPEILPPAVKGLPYPGAGGQHCSCLYKLLGRTVFTPFKQSSGAG